MAIDLHKAGAKDDSGKVDAGLLEQSFPRALYAVAEVCTYGCKKYTRDGWKSVPNGINRYTAAMARHRLNRNMGETRDPESKLLHRAHEAWNALALLELELTCSYVSTGEDYPQGIVKNNE